MWALLTILAWVLILRESRFLSSGMKIAFERRGLGILDFIRWMKLIFAVRTDDSCLHKDDEANFRGKDRRFLIS